MKNMIVLLMLFFASCQNVVDYYPTGKVDITNWRLISISGQRACLVTYSVSNSGLSKITTSAVSINAKTDLGVYSRTIIDTTPILPGNVIYGNIQINFISNTETVTLSNDISVIDSFFE